MFDVLFTVCDFKFLMKQNLKMAGQPAGQPTLSRSTRKAFCESRKPEAEEAKKGSRWRTGKV